MINVELIQATHNADDFCDEIAGLCYGQTGVSKKHARLKACIQSGHTSVLEHATFTFKITGVSRVLLAELTRHRMASYTVQSSRYCKATDNPIEGFSTMNHYYGYDMDNDVFFKMMDSIRASYGVYNELLDMGVKPEDARNVLPMCMPTEIVVTMNARALYNFFNLRLCKRAYFEIQELAQKMLKLVQSEAPVIFDIKYCGPGCAKDGCRESKPCGNPFKE